MIRPVLEIDEYSVISVNNYFIHIMKKIGTSLAVLTLFIASVSFAQVKSDYDKEADFSKYKTIQFIGWQENSDQLINDLDKERIYDAFINEFTEKGFELVEADGDLALTFFVVIDQKTSTTAYTNYYGGAGYGGYYRGGWGWGGGQSSTTYSENDYLQGTFVIDFYDSDTEKLVWQGVHSKAVTENPQKREKTIPKSVKKVLKNFPPKK